MNYFPVNINLNKIQWTITRQIDNALFRLEFDIKEGVSGENIVYINGYAGSAPVNLRFDNTSGLL